MSRLLSALGFQSRNGTSNGATYPPNYGYSAPQAQTSPEASRGILAWLRRAVGGWPGAEFAHNRPPERIVRDEKVRSSPSRIILPWFLPYFDDQSGETTAMRLAYRKMLADPNIKAAMLGKLMAVAALDPQAHPADKNNEHDQEVADFVQWALTERVEGCLPELIWSVLSGALIDGYSVCEKVWDIENKGRWSNKYIIERLKPKDTYNDLVLQGDEYRNLVGVMGLRYNQGEVFDPANFVIYQHLPLFGSLTGMSDMRAVYGRYWLLDTALKLRAIGLEKRALPLLVGEYDNPTVQPALESELAKAKWQNWISVPTQAKVTAVDLAGQGMDQFAQAVRDLKEDIFLGIQGATLQALTGDKGQQRGSSAVHQDTSDLFKWFLARKIESVFNDRETGLVRDLVDLNYVVKEYPRITLAAVDPQEMIAELQIDVGLHNMGLDLSKEALYERYDRVPPKKGQTDDCLQGGGSQQQGMPGMNGQGVNGNGKLTIQNGNGSALPFDEINLQTARMKLLPADLSAAAVFHKHSELVARHGPDVAGAVLRAAAELTGGLSAPRATTFAETPAMRQTPVVKIVTPKVPKQEPPIVNVHVEVPKPIIQVNVPPLKPIFQVPRQAPPAITVQPAPVEVVMQQPPEVKVNVEPAPVHVQIPDLKVEIAKPEPVKLKVKRDSDGNIKEIVPE